MRRPRRIALLGAAGAGLLLSAGLLGLVLRSGAEAESLGRVVPLVGAAFALYAVAAVLVLKGGATGRGALVLVVLVGLAARLVLAVHEPVVSRDAYRYVWDGRVAAAGINPYRYPPADPALVPLRDEEVYPNIDRRTEPTIYPPAAEGLFRALHAVSGGSVIGTKLALVVLDGLAIALLAFLLHRFGMRPERVVLYAWHPLAILEIGHSGHVDGVAALLLLLAVLLFAVRWPVATGIALAGATLVKLYAVAALPALLRRERRADGRLLAAFGATVVLAYLPFLGVGRRVLGYLPGYLEEEGISSGERFYLAPLAGGLPYAPLLVAAMAVLALRLWQRPAADGRTAGGRVLLLFVCLLVLATPSYPWYALLALAFLPLARGVVLLPATVLTATAPLLYVYLKSTSEPAWPLHVAYGGSAAALALAALWALRRPADRTLRLAAP